MPEQMFRSVVAQTITVGTRKWYTVPVSVLLHTLALAVVIAAPLMATGVLPGPGSMLVFTAPAPPPSPPPPVQPTEQVAPRLETPVVNPDVVPLRAPETIAPEPPPRTLVRQAGVSGGIPSGLSTSGLALAQPPVQPAPAFVRPGGNIKEPRKIRTVQPAYPPVALAAKIEGTVILEATISKDGNVVDAIVLRSQPLLDQAALDAVRQWKFTPTLLNGEAVEVKMTVTVNFSLAK